MAAMNHTFNNQSANCSTTAAACSSALICNRLDTAIILVVSILVCLISVLVRIPWLRSLASSTRS